MKLIVASSVIFGVFVVLAVYAETLAISGALGNSLSRGDTWVVALTLTAGTGIIGLSLAWPWMRRARWPIPAFILVIVPVVFMIWATAGLLTESVKLAAAKFDLVS